MRLAYLAVLVVLVGSMARADDDAFTDWPLRFDTPDGQITVYQPQPETLTGDQLTARSAVSLLPPGATDPVFGAMWINARIATDQDRRIVTILNNTIKHVRFPDSTDEQAVHFGQVLSNAIGQMDVTFSLDQLMASLDAAGKEKEAAAQLDNTPPKIIVANTPATLVILDGPPKLQPTDAPRVMQVVNTPFVMLFDMDAKRFFLKAGDSWATAVDIGGQWDPAPNVPVAIAQKGADLAKPAAGDVPQANAPAPPPGQIIVSQEPAELVWTDGAPAYTPLPGNDLLYVSNTQSDIFIDVGSQKTYVLLSGRWYRADTLKGPWEYVPSDKLPAPFAAIPADSPKAAVLASVAGTSAAKDARIETMIPQTATVRRDTGADLSVTYDGEPQFQPVENIGVSYAVNTPEPVLLVDRRYYCCHQAVWYVSDIPTGRWGVCISVPQVIYTLPPTCPVYYVRYCYVYDSTPDVVYCGYLPGYTGCYVYGATVVYGTGYAYHGWYGHAYYARPCTWGFGVRYDITVQSWGHGAHDRWDSRWLVAGGERRGWFGPREYVDYHELHRSAPRRVENVTNVTVINKTTVVNRLNIYNHTENVKRNITVNNTKIVEPVVKEKPKAAPVIRKDLPPTRNDVFADPNGEVYRKTDNGWEKKGSSGWSKVEEPKDTKVPTDVKIPKDPKDKTPPPKEPPKFVEPKVLETPRTPTGGLDSDYEARKRGAEKTKVKDQPDDTPPPKTGPKATPSDNPNPKGGTGGAGGGGGGGGAGGGTGGGKGPKN